MAFFPPFPRRVERVSSEVVVGAQCGSAVLRGAHVFAPGIVASPKCEDELINLATFDVMGVEPKQKQKLGISLQT